MRTRALAPLATLLSVITVCATARPASAQVYLRMDVSNQANGTFVKEMHTAVGQKIFLRLTALNTARVPLLSVFDIPMLKVRVGNVVQSYRIKSVLAAGKQASTTIVATASSAGTFKVATLLLWQNPYTGAMTEVTDNVLLVAGDDTSGEKGDKGGTLGTGGQQTGGTGGQQTSGGSQQQQQGGTKKDDTGTLSSGGQQTGGTGGQQTGGTGGQQTSGGSQQQQQGGTKKDDTGTAGTGGQQTSGGSQQQQQGGTKKDDTGAGIDYRF